MSKLARLGTRTRVALAATLVGALALMGFVLAPSATAEPSAQATLTRAEMLERAQSWLTANNGSRVPYSQTSTWSDGYRQDCSGYVSMTLKLWQPGPNTVGLANDRDLTTPITLGELEPGDLLIDAQGSNTTRHVVIFAGWTDSSQSAYHAYEQRGGYGTDYRVRSYGLEPGSEYKPYRPNNLTDGGDTPPPTDPAWPTLQQGSSGVDVEAAQYLLSAHGHPTTADGDFGPVTDSKVKEFQTAKGLVVDGVVGPQTWSALVVTVSEGSQGDAVKALQKQLNAHGANLSVDGDFGPVTKAAVESFQSNKRLEANGEVDSQTWKVLLGS